MFLITLDKAPHQTYETLISGKSYRFVGGKAVVAPAAVVDRVRNLADASGRALFRVQEVPDIEGDICKTLGVQLNFSAWDRASERDGLAGERS